MIQKFGLKYFKPWLVLSAHPVNHSDVVDACIDINIVQTVEWINRYICPTLFSCQGGGHYGLPSISIDYVDWDVFEYWLKSTKLSIGFAQTIDGTLHRASNKDVQVWNVKDSVVHIDFNFDHTKVFVD